jgi:TPR repeat protein
MLLNAQDVPPEPSESLGNAVANRSVPFVDLLREAEAGNESAQYDVANSYGTGSGVPKNDAEAVRWCLQAARKGFAKAQNRMGYLY